jgi:hypothetical protein
MYISIFNWKKVMKNKQMNIFNQNINNKYKLIPFNIKQNPVGDIKYSPATSKEWRNKVYFFNKSSIQNFPIYDINLQKIFKSYMNMYFNNKFLLKNFITRKLKRLSLNQIYISKPEIKHTNSKAIITTYVFNRERQSLLKRIRMLDLKKDFVNIKSIMNLLKDKYFSKIKENKELNKISSSLFIKNTNNKIYWYNIVFQFILLFLKKKLIFIRRSLLRLSLI